MPGTTRRSRQQAESADLELSVVIPCLNEADTIGICVEKAQRALRENRIAGEIVVANNGGTDGSQDIAISGLRGFTKDVQQRLHQRCTGMEFATETIIKSSLYCVKIAEVPITLHPDGRTSHAPHLKTFRDGWRTLPQNDEP